VTIRFQTEEEALHMFWYFDGLGIFSVNLNGSAITTNAPEAAVRGCLKALAERGWNHEIVIEKESWEE